MTGYYSDMKTTLRKIPIRLPEELAVRLEQEADGRPLSRYVARLIEQALEPKDKTRLRGMIEEMQTTNSVDALCDAYDPRGTNRIIPAGVPQGWDLALRELLRRLEAE